MNVSCCASTWLSLLSLLVLAGVVHAEPLVTVSLASPRRTFYRGEVVALRVRVANTGDSELEGLTMRVTAGPVASSVPLGRLGADANASALVRFDTSSLASSTYELLMEAIRDGAPLQAITVPIRITPRPDPQRLMVWLWPHQAYTDQIAVWGDHARRILDFWVDTGFNNLAVNRDIDEHATRFMDEALGRGATICLKPYGGLEAREFETLEDDEWKFQIGDGQFARDGAIANPLHPRVARWHTQNNRGLMEAVKDYPQVATAFFNSEIGDSLGNNRNEAGRRQMLEILGFQDTDFGDPTFVAKGVVADDDRRLRFERYVFTHGRGLAIANQRTANMVHRYRPDVLTITDPYRSEALLDGFPGIDVLGSWTYLNPDPKLALYVEMLRAACRDSGARPLSTVTLLNYPGELAPTDKWMMMGPGRLTVATWINLSRAPDVLGYYFSSVFDPFGALENDLTTKVQERPEFEMPRASFDALNRLSARVFEPLGALIRNLGVRPRRVALLSSQTARTFGSSPRLPGYYDNLQVMHFYTVLAMAHVPADIVLDETIERFGLDAYDVLVLPKCDVLSERVHQEVLAFQARGGLVVADQYLGPDLLPGAPVLRFDFDFTYRARVNANALAKSEMFAQWDDHIDPRNTEMTRAEGVTAKVDQVLMESYAAALRTGLDDHVRREVDCDHPTVLLNLCESLGAQYLFVINDKRDYGPRLGKFRSVLERIRPQEALVSIHHAPGAVPVAYDLLKRRRLDAAPGDTRTSFLVALDDLGGTILALYPRPLGGLRLETPTAVQRGREGVFAVSVLDDQEAPVPGLQPLEVRITDPGGRASEYSRFLLARRGGARWPLRPALNDEPGPWKIDVEDLTTGLRAHGSFEVQK